MEHKKLLFIGTPADEPYLAHLKPMFPNHIVSICRREPGTWVEAAMYCKKVGATGIFTTSQKLLEKLVTLDVGKPSINNYAGSFFKRGDIEVVVIDPLSQLLTVPYGKFITARFLSKLTNPKHWIDVQLNLSNSFSWQLFEPTIAEDFMETLNHAKLVAVDIETTKENLAITCVGYTAVCIDSFGRCSTRTVVVPMDSEFNLAWIRKYNSSPAAKVLQNGKYDHAYLARFGAPCYNYLWDTATMFHCMYSELPKDLGFLQSFFVREACYWKDLAKSPDKMQGYLYNGKDTWGTALALLGMLWEIPEYAKTNYLQEFPLLFPCHLSEMVGLKQDETARASQEAKYAALDDTLTKSLRRMLGSPNFNPGSSQQTKKLLKVLGMGDVDSADETALKKAMYMHPLNDRILSMILDIRGYRKLVSTYLVADKAYKGRILYSLNPHGTDTARLASREHHFWCGLQIQNIPRGTEVKETLVADDDFVLYECDLEQAESRDTAHIAGDESLIAAVSGTRDFHSVNASAFFGVPYEKIFSDELKKTIDKPLRDLAKRVNHGANYVMGPQVLVDTMGLANINSARKLLSLPKMWTPVKVAEHLLEQFHKTYPFLSGVFYPAVLAEIKASKKLTQFTEHRVKYQATKAVWVRYCFKNPEKNKRDKNAYIAHKPQNLNAMTLNKAVMVVFYELATHAEYHKHFKLHAQIHDSILFSVRKGYEFLAEKVKEAMEIPVTVRGCDGKVRTFTVPAALKGGATRWSKL